MWDDLNRALAKNLESLSGISSVVSALQRLRPTLSTEFLSAFKIPSVSFPFPKLPDIPMPKLSLFSLNAATLGSLRSSTFEIPDAFRNSFLSASLLPASIFHLPDPPITGFTQAIAAITVRVPPRRSGIGSTFVGEELAAIDDVEDAATLDQLEERFSTVENAVVEQIKKSPLVRISFEGWLNLLLTLFVFLYGVISSDKFQARLEGKADMIARVDERILTSQKKIYEALSERIQDSDMTGVLYVALREAQLKAKPFPKSRTFAFLFPNQLVKLEARKGKWILVSYFDYVDATIRSGWVLKKYLRRVGR